MPPAGFEPTIPVGDRLHTLALDRSVTGIGHLITVIKSIISASVLPEKPVLNKIVNNLSCIYDS